MSGFNHALTFKPGSWAYLSSRLKFQRELLAKIRAALPPELAAHAEHCVLAEKKLLLYTQSSPWASQLRFHEQNILNAVQADCGGISLALQVRLLSQNHPPLPSTRRVRQPGDEIIRVLETASAGMTDQTLKTALQKLTAALNKSR